MISVARSPMACTPRSLQAVADQKAVSAIPFHRQASALWPAPHISQQPTSYGISLRRQFFFGCTHHGNFGNGVDAVREQLGHSLAGDAEHVAAGQATLFHRCAGQRGKADHVTRSIDVGDSCLEMLIDGDFAARIRFQTCGFQAKLVAICLATNGVDETVSKNFFAAFQFREDAIPLFVNADARDFFTKPENRAQLAQMVHERIDDFPVDKIEDGSAVDQLTLP